ncbi:uncharacterized protein NDAI_0H00690 [Naumovozyma dairenensis CBS 421]|uniref:Uncharacterized protein n=1 Tax=Naumovozyma dairenensis (strain ATCC 10597 / BCRC 20456 / CBS 421 / NBRC 0211 / NRRL Y-12639) TaxID=1071378 RepID=G0WEN2_NAUDC|nr:hypothetical protein NDAI_0H00690 [Naumovozyma dairenensis CBS 421]CCD26243.1 hypothetical protein NDAI_0H00690 [Naumovozyma dairenensis CBS 421]
MVENKIKHTGKISKRTGKTNNPISARQLMDLNNLKETKDKTGDETVPNQKSRTMSMCTNITRNVHDTITPIKKNCTTRLTFHSLLSLEQQKDGFQTPESKIHNSPLLETKSKTHIEDSVIRGESIINPKTPRRTLLSPIILTNWLDRTSIYSPSNGSRLLFKTK